MSSSERSNIIQSRSEKKATITRLVCRQQWGLLEKLMGRDSFDIPIDDEIGVGGQNSISKDLLVHFICRFQAPLYIVRLFAKAYPESLTSFDALGRSPLHIACAWANSPDTLKFLVDSFPAAASIQDSEGKCPIHHLCHSFMLNYQDTHDIPCLPVKDSMMAIINTLNITAPKSFIVEDNDGMNAIEYAIESEVNIKIIKTMQRACRDVWREMKQETTAPHDALQLDLQRIQRDLRNQHISTSASVNNIKRRVAVKSS